MSALKYWDGTAWVTVGGGGTGGPFAYAQLALVANPPGTTSTTGTMAGYGTATYGPFLFTPTVTGRALIIITGSVANNVASAASTISARYGTGTAPVNGAAATGTIIGTAVSRLNQAVNAWTPFTISGAVTGMTVGTQYWIDVTVASGVGTTTTSVSAVYCSVVELPSVGGVFSVPPPKTIWLGTGSGTYTPSAGVRALYVEVVGGGGGGGGAKAAASSSAAGGGGGGGGWASVYVPTPAASYPYVAGGGGAGGPATAAANGTTGTTSTFGSPSICTATGGSGGQPDATARTAPILTAFGGLGGAGTVGDAQGAGGDGTYGLCTSGTVANGGNGGDTLFGSICRAIPVNNPGQTGHNYGSGGGGGCSGSATGQAGGAGAGGVIKIIEYF